MIFIESSEKKYIIIGVLLLFFFTHFFQYKYWSLEWGGRLNYVISGAILMFFLKSKKYIEDFPFNNLVKSLFVVAYLHLFPFIIIYGESVYDARHFLLGYFVFLLYYIFQVGKISERCIISVMTIFGILFFFIQLIQQFVPDSSVFGVYDENRINLNDSDVAEIRNGLYRFRLPGFFVVLFCLYYYWQNLLKKFEAKHFFLFFCFLCSIYLTLTRQIIFATFVTLIVSFFFKDNKAKRYFPIVVIFISIFLCLFSDVLFGEFIEKTTDEANKDNVRNLCFLHYWNQVTSDVIPSIFGHGNLKIQEYWQDMFRFYRTDIGLFGEWFLNGLLWILIYFYTIYLVLYKHRETIPLYIKLFVFGTFINSFMVFPYRSRDEFFVWVSMLYCASLYIAGKNDLLVEENMKESI